MCYKPFHSDNASKPDKTSLAATAFVCWVYLIYIVTLTEHA